MQSPAALRATLAPGTILVAENGIGPLGQTVLAGRHDLSADEPIAAGGRDGGPGPYDYLLVALGACTSMTVRLYADRKVWPLEQVIVRLRHAKIHARDCAECETREGFLDRIERDIELVGALDGEQRARLMDIADKCPVHRTLTGEVKIVTRAL